MRGRNSVEPFCFEGGIPDPIPASPWVKQLEQQLKRGQTERQAVNASILSDLSTASASLKTKEAQNTKKNHPTLHQVLARGASPE